MSLYHQKLGALFGKEMVFSATKSVAETVFPRQSFLVVAERREGGGNAKKGGM